MKIFLPNEIASMSSDAVRAAYSHLRGLANARIGRMSARGLGKATAPFKTLRGMSDQEAAQGLAEVSRWMRDPRHTVRGYIKQRAFQLESFHEKGYDFVNEENYEDFVTYMEELREEYGSKVFDSAAAADVYGQGQRIGIPTETLKNNFDYFVEHLDQLDDMRPVRSERGATMRAIKDKVRKLQA